MGTTTVPVNVPAGAIYEFGGGSAPHVHVWTAGSDLTGAGTAEFTSAESTFDGGFNFAGDLIATGGSAVISTATPNLENVTLDGGGDITIVGAATIAGSVINTGNSSAMLILPTGGTIAGDLTIEGHVSNEIRGAGTLAVAGDLFWRLGEIAEINVTINGTSTLEGGNKEIHEAGSLTLNGPSNWTAGNFEFYNDNSEIVNNGSMAITTTAAMNRAAGISGLRFHNTNLGTVNVTTGNTITIGGSLGPSVLNDELISLPAGSTLNTAGGITQTASGTLRIGVLDESGPGVGTGLLTGLVDMIGTLELDVDPSFTPVSQADYTIITSSGVGNDDFTTITDVASGLSGTPPTNTVDSLTHTWEVQYTLGVDVTLHTLNIFPVADPIADMPGRCPVARPFDSASSPD